jgi:GNAT superfamily N-acetyltransferase
MPLVVREAEDSDFAGVGEVDAASRLYAYTGLLDPANLAAVTPETQARIWGDRASRERDTHVMLVADQGGRVVGYSYVGPGDDPEIGDLYALFVHPDVLGTGVAQRLLDESLSVLRGFGYQIMLLWVLEGNDRAIRFYEKSGWRHDGTRRVSSRGPASLRYLYP